MLEIIADRIAKIDQSSIKEKPLVKSAAKNTYEALEYIRNNYGSDENVRCGLIDITQYICHLEHLVIGR